MDFVCDIQTSTQFKPEKALRIWVSIVVYETDGLAHQYQRETKVYSPTCKPIFSSIFDINVTTTTHSVQNRCDLMQVTATFNKAKGFAIADKNGIWIGFYIHSLWVFFRTAGIVPVQAIEQFRP